MALVSRLPKKVQDECALRSQQLSAIVAENMPAVSAPSPVRLTPGRQIVVLCGLALVLGVQLVAAVRQWSITSDEINHLHAGYRYLTCGDFGWNPEHPPLLKLVAALPLLAMQVNDPAPGACGLANSKAIDFHVGHDFIFSNPERMLMAGRAAASLFVFALLALVWFGARRMFGVEAAIIASSLLVFEPNILAHGALVTTDMAASFGFLAVVLALYLYFESRVASYLILTGVATGIALAVKHSSVAGAGIARARRTGSSLRFTLTKKSCATNIEKSGRSRHGWPNRRLRALDDLRNSLCRTSEWRRELDE